VSFGDCRFRYFKMRASNLRCVSLLGVRRSERAAVGVNHSDNYRRDCHSNHQRHLRAHNTIRHLSNLSIREDIFQRWRGVPHIRNRLK
jgi:hypothetical protein